MRCSGRRIPIAGVERPFTTPFKRVLNEVDRRAYGSVRRRAGTALAPCQGAVDDSGPVPSQCLLHPEGGGRLGSHGAAVKGIEHTAHCQHGIGLVADVMAKQRPRVRAHRAPPGLHDLRHRQAEIIGVHGIDQGAWCGAGDDQTAFTQDVQVDHPASVELVASKDLVCTALDAQMMGPSWIVATQSVALNVERLNLGGPR